MRIGLANADFAQQRQLVELPIDRVPVSDGVVEIRYVILLSAGSGKVRFCHVRRDYFDFKSAREAACAGRHHGPIRIVRRGQVRRRVQSHKQAPVPAERPAKPTFPRVGALTLGGREFEIGA